MGTSARPGIAGRIAVGRWPHCRLVSGTHGVWAAGAGEPLAPGRSAASGNARNGSTVASSIGSRSGRLPLRSWRKRRPPGLSSPRIGQGRALRETSCSWPILSAPTCRSLIPAVVHADGTCRIQTVSRQRQPRFHRLISAFSRMTGVPLVLNTSYNEQEPMVLTPDDALATFLKTRIDALFLNDRLVLRRR